jgi:NDP-sugar pyrophosphorylase family protein
MKAMILAAGLGTRLRPLTNHLPKPLLPVANRPLIHYNLLLLKRYGITDVVINLHYYADKLRGALGDGSELGMRITYSEEPEILGTGGGLKKVSNFFSNRSFILINGDILVDVNLDKVVEYHHRKKALATMVLREDPEVERWGTIEMDSQGRIRRILEKGNWVGEKLVRYMFTGIHVLEPQIFNYLPDSGFSTIIDAYTEMVKKDERVFGYVMTGYWMDLGTPERYQKAHQEMVKGLLKLSYLR